MSFTDTVKEELCHAECTRPCCARAEISAAILLSGGLSFRGRGRYGLSVTVSRASVSRYFFTLVKRYLGVTCEIRTLRAKRLGETSAVELFFPEDSVPRVMDELLLHDENALFGVPTRPHPSVVENACCRAAFLKSAFLVTGYISSPEKEYALTLSCAASDMAGCLSELMHGMDISASVSPRRSAYVVYVKDAESVSVFLTLSGAHSARLNLENVRIMKELKNQTNRLTNCDNNNIERSVKSARQQTDAIRFLAKEIGFDRLPEWAREIASLRLENPEASLGELGALCDPPIGKSGVNSRLRRLADMARRLKEVGTPETGE